MLQNELALVYLIYKHFWNYECLLLSFVVVLLSNWRIPHLLVFILIIFIMQKSYSYITVDFILTVQRNLSKFNLLTWFKPSLKLVVSMVTHNVFVYVIRNYRFQKKSETPESVISQFYFTWLDRKFERMLFYRCEQHSFF